MLQSTALFRDAKACAKKGCKCPLRYAETFGPIGLMGVGASHYKKPKDFIEEAIRLGVSKRIPRVPKELELGKTWVFLAHKKAIEIYANDTLLPDMEIEKFHPGIFYAFIPEAIEVLVDEGFAKEEIDAYKKRGFRIVEVPISDEDHH
jgi:hypothetical protein